MAVRPIDANAMLNELRPLGFEAEHSAVLLSDVSKMMREWVERQPTLTPPNEWVTLISMNDEVPPDNERVLVYRPCMVDSDTGPYSVQWGWAAKRDGSHWAHLPDHRPPERQEDT